MKGSHLAAAEEVILAVVLGYGKEKPDQHPRTGANVIFIG
jgi:hypothetical protein